MVAAAAVVTLAFVGTSGAAGPKTLKTFGTAEVSVAGTSATIVVDPGEYGGVYYNSKSQGGKLLANTIFAFTSRGDVEGGAPRWSIPINDGAFDVNQDYAFIDASRCGATVGDNPTNQATSVSTQNPYCHVNWHGVEYDNWATFAFGHPGYTVMKAYLPFIIADSPLDPNGTPATATYVVTDIFAG
jgi:hypothetical protein